MNNKLNGAGSRPTMTIDIETHKYRRHAYIKVATGAQVIGWQDRDANGRWSRAKVGMSWPGVKMNADDDGFRVAEDLADAIKLMAAQVRAWIAEAE